MGRRTEEGEREPVQGEQQGGCSSDQALPPAATLQHSFEMISYLGIQGPSAAVSHPWYPEHPDATAAATHTAGKRTPCEYSTKTLRAQRPPPAILGVLCELCTSLRGCQKRASDSFTGGVRGQSPPVKLSFLFKQREPC